MVATNVHLLFFTIHFSLICGSPFASDNSPMGVIRHGDRQPGDELLYSDIPFPPNHVGNEFCFPPRGSNDQVKITSYEIKDSPTGSDGGSAFDVSGGVGQSQICLTLKTQNAASSNYKIDIGGFRISSGRIGTGNYNGMGAGSYPGTGSSGGMDANSYGRSGGYGGGNSYGSAAGSSVPSFDQYRSGNPSLLQGPPNNGAFRQGPPIGIPPNGVQVTQLPSPPNNNGQGTMYNVVFGEVPPFGIPPNPAGQGPQFGGSYFPGNGRGTLDYPLPPR